MRNNFVVSLTRFHMSDPNRYVLQGYFEGNTAEGSRITAQLDGVSLQVETGAREGLGIRQKYFSRGIGYENIDREYDLWISLPSGWESGKRLRVFQETESEGQAEKERRCIFRVGTGQLKKERRMTDGYLETFRVENGKVYIGGWAVGDERCRFKVTDGEGHNLPGKVTWHYRQDIVDSYPEAEGPADFGYELCFDRPKTDRITLTVATKTRRSVTRLNLKHGIGKGALNPSPLKKTAAYFKRYGLARTIKRAGQKVHEGLTGQREGYMAWRKHVIPSANDLEAQRAATFSHRPLISIAVPLYRTDEKLLDALVESVRAQTYDNWELCLSDGSGHPSPLEGYLKKLTEKDGRIKVITSKERLGISENTNRALSIATGDLIAFADHDDLLPPWALYEVVREVNEHPETELIYSDEDKVKANGKTFFQPHFKSDFNIDLLCSMNYFCHLVVVSRALLEAVELDSVGSDDPRENEEEVQTTKESGDGERRWFDPSFDGAQDYDFVLRCVDHIMQRTPLPQKANALTERIRHIPKVLYHWRSLPSSTSENPESKRYAFEAGARAVQAHFERVGVEAEVEQGAYPGLYRVRYVIPQPEPLISIIIPNRDHVADLQKCVSSIMERSAYRNFEFVVIENGSCREETFAYYRACEEAYENFRVLTWSEGFNYSAINNFGAAKARGDYLLFLNNDTQMTDPDLLKELVGPALRKEVGAVGARLFYEDGTIQHAGVIIGYGGIAGHAFQFMDGRENGYFSRIICQSDLSAVTAACMLVRRDAFEEVGGFDPQLAVAFNDIDFCLRLRERGYLIVYNPFAVMIHYESKSRGMEDSAGKIARFNSEADELLRRWGKLLKDGDPYYNPNLTLAKTDFSLRYEKQGKA